jgi:hypothetical protein
MRLPWLACAGVLLEGSRAEQRHQKPGHHAQKNNSNVASVRETLSHVMINATEASTCPLFVNITSNTVLQEELSRYRILMPPGDSEHNTTHLEHSLASGRPVYAKSTPGGHGFDKPYRYLFWHDRFQQWRVGPDYHSDKAYITSGEPGAPGTAICPAENTQWFTANDAGQWKRAWDMKVTAWLDPCAFFDGVSHPDNKHCCAASCGAYCGLQTCASADGGAENCCEGKMRQDQCGLTTQAPCTKLRENDHIRQEYHVVDLMECAKQNNEHVNIIFTYQPGDGDAINLPWCEARCNSHATCTGYTAIGGNRCVLFAPNHISTSSFVSFRKNLWLVKQGNDAGDSLRKWTEYEKHKTNDCKDGVFGVNCCAIKKGSEHDNSTKKQNWLLLWLVIPLVFVCIAGIVLPVLLGWSSGTGTPSKGANEAERSSLESGQAHSQPTPASRPPYAEAHQPFLGMDSTRNDNSKVIDTPFKMSMAPVPAEGDR